MIETVKWESNRTEPILRKSSLFNSYKEIVYKIRGKEHYIPDSHLILLDHDEYRINNNKFKSFYTYRLTEHAYGILINVRRSRILVLDLDNKDLQSILKLIDFLLQCNQICGIDLIQSSNISYKKHWHIHAELYKEYDLLPFYTELGLSINIVCIGHIRNMVNKNFGVLRVSQKFKPIGYDTNTIPILVKSFRKLDGKWTQCIPIKDRTSDNYRFSLRRINNGHNTTKQKSKGEESAETSSRDDSICFFDPNS